MIQKKNINHYYACDFEIIIHCAICGMLKSQTILCEFGMDCPYFGRIGCRNIICPRCRKETKRNCCNECFLFTRINKA